MKTKILIIFLLISVSVFVQDYIVTVIAESSENNNPVIIVNPTGVDNPETKLNYEPQLIGLILGQNDTITWVNEDDNPFDVVGNGWKTPRIESGQSASVIFNSTGIYDYSSSTHPWKEGIVSVVKSAEITFDNMDKRMEMTQQILEQLGHTQANIEYVFPDLFAKQVIVSFSADEFTKEKTSQYYENKLKDWIPFETRISIATDSGSDSPFAYQGGMSPNIESIKFLEESIVFSGYKYRAMKLAENLDELGSKEITKTFDGINFHFFETDFENNYSKTKVIMQFPDGQTAEISVHHPMKHMHSEENIEKFHPYFSSSNNRELPIFASILSLDDKKFPTYLLTLEKQLSLTEQYTIGIPPIEAGCKSGLQKYEKNNGDFICIKESTFYEILQRGYFDSWKVNDMNVNYYFESEINNIELKDDSLIITFEEHYKHELLIISFPKKLIDVIDEDGKDIEFRMLFDGEISRFPYPFESNKNNLNRNLNFMIPENTKIVEILGTT